METHEHEGCKTPLFEGYWKVTMWNEVSSNGKEHGGIMVLVKEKEGRVIHFGKEILTSSSYGSKSSKIMFFSGSQYVTFLHKSPKYISSVV